MPQLAQFERFSICALCAFSRPILRCPLSFGNVNVGGFSDRFLTISNAGNATLTVTSISYPSGFGGNWAGTVPPNVSTNVNVTFTPTSPNTYAGNLTVNSDATSGTSTRAVWGTGIPAPTRIVMLGGDLAFGSVQIGSSSNRMLIIENSGDSALTVSGIVCPTGFIGNWSGMIASGASTNVTVTFIPSLPMSYSGNLVVLSDATAGISGKSASGFGIMPAPSLSSVNSGVVGGFSFSVSTVPGLFYSIEASTNLVRWETILTTNAVTSLVSFVEADTTSRPQRFYRVKVQVGPPQTDGLVAYYPMDGNAQDASGNGIHGVVSNAVPTADVGSHPNSAYYFSNGACILLGSPAALKFGPGDFTVSAWALFNGGYWNPRIVSFGGDTGYELFTSGTGATRRFGLTGGGVYFLSTNLYPSDAWHHVTATKTGNSFRLYVNGILDGEQTASFSPSYSGDLRIGMKGLADFDWWGGAIDEVRFYNRALSASEIQALHLLAGLVAYYPLDGNAEDASGNGLDGTVFGASFDAGALGSAANFNGVDAHIGIPSAAINNLSEGTIAVWVKLQKNTDGIITAKQHDQYDSYGILQVGTQPHRTNGVPGRVYFHAKNDVQAYTSTNLSVGPWYHIAVAFNSSEARFYINGVLDNTVPGNFSIPSDLDPVTVSGLGAWVNDNGPATYHWFHGSLDEVRIYNRVLSATEVQQLHDLGN